MRELTFACVLYQGGNDIPEHSRNVFDSSWVDKLYRGVRRNLDRDFNFVCFVDKDDYEFKEEVEPIKLFLPYRNMLSLLEPFRLDLGRVIFMGLDTIIMGNLDQLVDYDGPFAMLRDPNRPEIGCSGVMSFPYSPWIWEEFINSKDHLNNNIMFGYPSDMGFLEKINHEYLDDKGIEGIYSYKVHIRENPRLLEYAKIIYFHGKSKPHEIGWNWVKDNWK